MTEIWNKLPDKLRAAIVASALLIVGAATELAIAWLEAVKNGVGA